MRKLSFESNHKNADVEFKFEADNNNVHRGGKPNGITCPEERRQLFMACQQEFAGLCLYKEI